jgi:hypothetical protein
VKSKEHTQATENDEQTRPENSDARGWNPFGAGVGFHHVHQTKMIHPCKKEEPSVEDATSEKQVLHASLPV